MWNPIRRRRELKRIKELLRDPIGQITVVEEDEGGLRVEGALTPAMAAHIKYIFENRDIMISEDYQWIVCDEPDCTEKIKNHRWGKTKAEGWFFGQGQVNTWCPKHIPPWVVEWRKRQTKGTQ